MRGECFGFVYRLYGIEEELARACTKDLLSTFPKAFSHENNVIPLFLNGDRDSLSLNSYGDIILTKHEPFLSIAWWKWTNSLIEKASFKIEIVPDGILITEE